MIISTGFVGGSALLTESALRDRMWEIYDGIEVGRRSVSNKKICSGGFKTLLECDPPSARRPARGRDTEDRPTYIEIKREDNAVIGAFSGGYLKVVTAKMNLSDHDKVSRRFQDDIRWFLECIGSDESKIAHSIINNISAHFEIGCQVPHDRIHETFETRFHVCLPSRESPPYNITRLRPKSDAPLDATDETEGGSGPNKGPVAQLTHSRGYVQVMGTSHVSQIEDIRRAICACLEEATWDRLPPLQREQSAFRTAGIPKGRGRPSKKQLELLRERQSQFGSA